MKKSEFYRALTAYLNGTANSWQEFILEDYYESFQHCPDILDNCSKKKIAIIGKKILSEIDKSIEGT